MSENASSRLSLRMISFKRVVLFLVLLLMLFGIVKIIQIAHKYNVTLQSVKAVVTGDVSLLKQHQKRSNILLLGKGGGVHDGGELTDTIMIASIGLEQPDVVLISLPRDIWIPTLKDKLNAAYKQGEEKAKGSGLLLAKAAVEEIVGIPIHYAAVIDFMGFKEIIDVIGGIEVTIEESFTDKLYPIAGKENDLCNGDPLFACRYETITFNQGVEHMNGERALKYVRSRHAEGEAGNDFSRGKRQQAVLSALKNKLTNSEVYTNTETMKSFIVTLQNSISTDIPTTDTFLFMRTYIGKSTRIRSTALTQDEPEKEKKGLLINPPVWQYNGVWVLIPKHTDYSHIHNYLNCVIKQEEKCESFFD